MSPCRRAPLRWSRWRDRAAGSELVLGRELPLAATFLRRIESYVSIGVPPTALRSLGGDALPRGIASRNFTPNSLPLAHRIVASSTLIGSASRNPWKKLIQLRTRLQSCVAFHPTPRLGEILQTPFPLPIRTSFENEPRNCTRSRVCPRKSMPVAPGWIATRRSMIFALW